MKNILLIFAISCSICYTCYADTLTVKVMGDKVITSIKPEEVNVSQCIQEGKEFYPNKSVEAIEKMCCYAFIDYVIEQANKNNKVVITGTLHCRDEWLNRKGQ